MTIDVLKLREQADILREVVPHLDAAADLLEQFNGRKPSSASARTAGKSGRLGRNRRAPNGTVKPLMIEILKEQGKPTKLKELVGLMSKRSGIAFKVDTVSKLLYADSQFTRPGRGLYALAPANGNPASDGASPRATKPKSAQKSKVRH